MLRSLLYLLLALSNVVPVQAQQPGPTPSLAQLLRQLPGTANAKNPLAGLPMGEALCKASLTELKANLPALVDLTENPAAPVRWSAIESFMCIAPGDPTLPSVDQHTPWAAEQLLVPFIPRLIRCLTDPDPTVRPVCLGLMANLVLFIRPTQPPLLDALFKALEDPGSTKPAFASAAQPGHWSPLPLIMGPQIVYALIPANATVQVDPITQKRVMKTDPDVQEAILRFLHRPDQTSQSLSETIDRIVVAGLTDPDFNAQLLSFLDYPDDTVRIALARDLNRLAFPSSSVPTIQARLTQLASDAAASSQLRAEAARILPCWGKDRTCVLLPSVQAPAR
jgi:HEAT repeat protein